MVGLSIDALLDWPLATRSGFACFLDAEVNAMLKRVLNARKEYFESPASADVLEGDSKSWFSEMGVKELAKTGNIEETSYSF